MGISHVHAAWIQSRKCVFVIACGRVINVSSG